MYLSTLKPNTYSKNLAIGLLFDEQKMHEILTGIFQKTRKEENLLYKKIINDKNAIIFLQSDDKPENNDLFDIETVNIDERIQSYKNGDIFHYKITTSPYKKYNDRRVCLKTKQERLKWLSRKATQNGFVLLTINEKALGKTKLRHNNQAGEAHLTGYEYEGYLKVTDHLAFVDGYKKGIGPNKAYGFGMLILGKCQEATK